MKTHNKPVIFIDFGGVYFTYASKGLGRSMKKFGLTERQLLKILVVGPHWTDHATGKTNEDSYW